MNPSPIPPGAPPETPLHPWDAANRKLYNQVHPPDWVNPTPTGRYNLVVIGGGTGGLVAAAGAAGLGAKVALIEQHLLGGDCLNVGCVPSKALLRAGRAAAEARRAGEFGIHVPSVEVDFARVMQRLREVRANISPHDSAERFRKLGVDVFLGRGRFLGGNEIEVGETKLRFARAVIATGARAAVPDIPGLAGVRHLTNETVFSLTELPRRFAVVGAGPIGCELAQAFARLGSEVFLIETTHGVLPREDRDAAAVVQSALAQDGVQVLCCGRELRVAQEGGQARLFLESHGVRQDLLVDQLLVATGRAPNVEGMGLEQAGVEFDRKKGVQVNDRLQTSNSRIFACGDVCSEYRFTHAADFTARIVIQNALFYGRKRVSDLLIPWATYTAPEVAHVGLSAEEATAERGGVTTLTQPLTTSDRALIDGEAGGFVRVHLRGKSDRIVGATIVAAHAGEMISELTLAMQAGIGLQEIGSVIHPYPTVAEAIRKLGDVYRKSRFTPRVQRLFHLWLRWTR